MTHVPWHPDNPPITGELHGIESVQLLSVGIDIGTTTTQLMFSEMIARRKGGEHSTKFVIEERNPVYESEIWLTPYTDVESDRIDAEKIGEYVEAAYEDAGYEVGDVDTGAVIITGEASRTENADRIIDVFSEQSGKFVCAVAGANLETLMAAHGSGAVDYAVDESARVLHVDVGGGTTKMAYIDEGFVEDTASINVGARLVAFDEEGRITRLEDAARKVAADVGVDLERGETLTQEEKDLLAERFAELLVEAISGETSDLAEELLVTDLPAFPQFDTITFSGGGAEYIYDREKEYFGDLGPELGRAIHDAVEAEGFPITELETGIRATAVGSTQHTVQVSGNTITITDESLLPLRNVPMVPFVADHDDTIPELTAQIDEKLDLYDVDDINGPFALGFHLHGLPEHDFLNTVVEASIHGWKQMGSPEPLVLAFESDVAMNVGRMATERVDAPVVAVDGVDLDQFGYIDVGELLEDTNAVPITVKSLVFEG
ncbi:MAG: ethanolamine ammonia-lyase reactivating factor EutA [Haloferacaceae archaeon]